MYLLSIKRDKDLLLSRCLVRCQKKNNNNGFHRLVVSSVVVCFIDRLSIHGSLTIIIPLTIITVALISGI